MAPLAFLVIGSAGSGKSTVARAIAKRARAAYLDKDAIAGPLVELLLSERGEAPWERDENAFYQERIFPLEYDSVLAVAGDNLRLGTSVVVDAPFRRYTSEPGYLEAATARLEWPSTEMVVVHVDVSPDLLRARITERGNDRDRWKLAHWDEFWAQQQRDRCAWIGATHVRVPNDDEMDLTPLEPYLSRI